MLVEPWASTHGLNEGREEEIHGYKRLRHLEVGAWGRLQRYWGQTEVDEDEAGGSVTCEVLSQDSS